jgi:hypothetical protein
MRHLHQQAAVMGGDALAVGDCRACAFEIVLDQFDLRGGDIALCKRRLGATCDHVGDGDDFYAVHALNLADQARPHLPRADQTDANIALCPRAFLQAFS